MVLFNNSPRSLAGRVVAVPPMGEPAPRPDLAAALGFDERGAGDSLTARVHLSGGGPPEVDGLSGGADVTWEVARLRADGLRLTLEPYQAVVFLDIVKELHTRQDEEARRVALVAAGRSRRPADWTPAMLARPRRYAAQRRAAARRRR